MTQGMPGPLTIFSPSLRSAQPLACRLIETAVAGGRVANGYLLTGHALSDKTELVRQLACFLNCRHADRDWRGSCLIQNAGQPCLNCQWLAAGQHPQAWLQLKGEGRSGKVPVETARLLTLELAKTSVYARIVIVDDAKEAIFHRPAANALLKIIEEPPPDVLFFFFADNEQDVLTTIVSRCQVISLCKRASTGTSGAVAAGDELAFKIREAARKLSGLPDRHTGKRVKGEHYPQNVEDALLLSRQLQDLLKQYQESMEEHSAYAAVLDAFLTGEHQQIKESACHDSTSAAYLRELVALADASKRKNQSYIKPANALDSFCLSLIDLRQTHFGDASFAKR